MFFASVERLSVRNELSRDTKVVLVISTVVSLAHRFYGKPRKHAQTSRPVVGNAFKGVIRSVIETKARCLDFEQAVQFSANAATPA